MNRRSFFKKLTMAIAAIGAGMATSKEKQKPNMEKWAKSFLERDLPGHLEPKILAPPFPTEQAHEFRLDNLVKINKEMEIKYGIVGADFNNLGFVASKMI